MPTNNHFHEREKLHQGYRGEMLCNGGENETRDSFGLTLLIWDRAKTNISRVEILKSNNIDYSGNCVIIIYNIVTI